MNFKRTIANEHVIRNTQFGAVELAFIGLEPLRRRLGDQDAPHRNACAILMEDSILSSMTAMEAPGESPAQPSPLSKKLIDGVRHHASPT